MKMRFMHGLITLLLLSAGVYAQELGDVALHQALLDLGNPFRMVCFAAHPDDEDGATLAYYRMKYGVETHAVVATRGEGGQNEIGPELYEELGVIRTREMMAASAIEGAELHFLDLPEFGYSKTREETEAVWGEGEALWRVTRLIRQLRPQVIITNHGRMQDHGHHQAIGAAVIEAFDRAADERYRTDEYPPWQVSRLFIRAWDGGPDSIESDISELEPVRGKTYAEIAADALREHKSQGMQFFIDRYLTGQPRTYYDLVKGEPMPADVSSGLFPGFFAGLPLPAGWTHEAVMNWRAVLSKRGEPDFAERVRNTPRPWHRASNSADLRLMACLDELRMSLHLDDWTVTPGQALKVRVELRDFGKRDYEKVDIELDAHRVGRDQSASSVPFDETGVASMEFTVPVGDYTRTVPQADYLRTSVPAWSNLDVMAWPRPPRPLRPSEADNAIMRPVCVSVHVDVAPPVLVAPRGAPLLLRQAGERAIPLDVLLTNHEPGAHEDTLSLVLPDGWTTDAERMSLSFAGEDEQQQQTFRIQAPSGVTPGSYTIGLRMDSGYETEATVRVVDLNIPEGKRVGVVQSYDDTFVKTLAKMGVPHELVALGDFTPDRLDKFSTIIVDIRAYLNRPDLVANNQTLLDYVARGGAMIVMYQKTFEWQPEFAPYPIRLSHNRVTREDAPVTLLDPAHPLFNTPNPIVPADWDGWRQERGLYFPYEWDPAYTPLIACTDPGEDIPPGACLIARHGKGTYCYTALGWYRQLRELYPGALRVFANMLAL